MKLLRKTEITFSLDMEKVKFITKEIAECNYSSKEPIGARQQSLGQEIGKFNFDMYCKIKLNRKTFTVLNDPFLRNIRIEQDSDGIPEDDLIKVHSILDNDHEAFFEIVEFCRKGNKKSSYSTEFHIFYLGLNSKYTSNVEDIYFTSENGVFSVMFENRLLITLENYISSFFSSISKDVKDKLNTIQSDKVSNHQLIQKKLREAFVGFEIEDDDFIEGAISFFDFLGWKGLWHNSSAPNALREISELVDDYDEYLHEETKECIPGSTGMKISRLISISDTIAFFTPKVSTVSEIDLLELHAKISRFILEKSIKKKYPIRGAVCYGKYKILKNVMIGPGIDECASWHESCDWIGALFTPSAEFVLRSSNSRNGIIEYEGIPVKSGVPSVKFCIEWKIEDKDFNDLLYTTQSLLPEIAGKYLNTKKFLEKTK